LAKLRADRCSAVAAFGARRIVESRSSLVEEYLRQMMSGPGHLRFFVQPLVALLLGVRDGLRDHRLGRAPFLHSVVRDRGNRKALLRDGLRGILVPLLIAVSASYLFQWLIRFRIRLLPGLLYAVLFVAFPYICSRGFSNRAAGLWRRRIPPSRGPTATTS
jgi:hypothetical protein